MIPHCCGFHKVGLDMMMIKYCLCGSIAYIPSVYFARRMGSLRVFHGGCPRTHLILLMTADLVCNKLSYDQSYEICGYQSDWHLEQAICLHSTVDEAPNLVLIDFAFAP